MIITSTFKPTRPAPLVLPELSDSSTSPGGMSAAASRPNGFTVPNPDRPAVVLPFRRRLVRQASERNLEQAVAFAVRLLVIGRVDEAEHRFRELATVARSLDLAERRSAWHLPSWVGRVVCHALRGEWLSAEMAACEHLAEMDVADVAGAYIAAVALGNQWLVNLPEHHRLVEDDDHPAELRRFPRSTPPRESAHPDPARDYAYALVSALRFRLGSGDA